MKYYIDHVGASVNRGVYGSSLFAEETVLETREALCRLFNFPESSHVIFTLNITYALNMLLKGMLLPGDHCIVSSMEHNAIMRPLTQLTKQGVTFTRVQADSKGFLNPDDVRVAIRSNTRAVVMTHASNVCGTVLPLREIGQICHEHGILFVMDSAQTAGALPIDFDDFHLDALAFTGHKSLLGPPGVGGFLLSSALAAAMDPLISGGTGSLSDSEEVPPFLPDKFEAGTPNIPGIFGLHAALQYLEKEGVDNLHAQAMQLTGQFLEGAAAIKGINVAGAKGTDGRTSVVSLDFPGADNAEIAHALDKQYGIMTRSGMHCAPSAHQTLGTFPHGTVRFSFSHSNTKEEIHCALEALERLTAKG